MKKKWMFRALLVIMAALSLHDLAGFAQSAITSPGKFVTTAEWKNMIEIDKPALGIVAGHRAAFATGNIRSSPKALRTQQRQRPLEGSGWRGRDGGASSKEPASRSRAGHTIRTTVRRGSREAKSIHSSRET
jgi:hypothetical protein